MKQHPDHDPRPAPGTRPPEYVAELWVSHQIKDKIHHLDPAPAAEVAPAGPAARARAGGRAVTGSPDHPGQPATSHGPTGAGHRAEASARCGEEHAQAARSVDCECQAKAGAPCGPAGDHLARYVRAHHGGALTKDSLKDVIAELDVIAPRALIKPPDERAASAGTATTAGHAIRGQASTEMSADGAGASARSAPSGRGSSAIHARQEPELEAGS